MVRNLIFVVVLGFPVPIEHMLDYSCIRNEAVAVVPVRILIQPFPFLMLILLSELRSQGLRCMSCLFRCFYLCAPRILYLCFVEILLNILIHFLVGYLCCIGIVLFLCRIEIVPFLLRPI